MMANSLKGNDAGMRLQNGRNGKLLNSWHCKKSQSRQEKKKHGNEWFIRAQI
jgi:hypothetical protein